LSSSLTFHRGPELPYDLVAGVKPCATGWLVAVAKLRGTTFAPEEPKVLETFVEVLDQRPAFKAIALNAPIGHLDEYVHGGRTCDREARALVGPRRGAAVPSAPLRRQVEEVDGNGSDGLSAITAKLLPKYREVAAEMAPYLQRTVYEVTSELSFFQLNEDQPLKWAKRTELGQQERRDLLVTRIPGCERLLDTVLERVPASHILDVAAFMWTARRIFARAAVRIPEDPEWDDSGMRMEIVR
jgi:predicted RNase H-like nuclease